MEKEKPLKIVGVHKSFGNLQALKDVSFTIEPGRIHGIIGPNGSGKTTLFNCISGIIPPDSGHIYFGDTEISGLRADRIAKAGIRRTFQAGKLKNKAGRRFLLKTFMAGLRIPGEGSATFKEGYVSFKFIPGFNG